jgi:hypothetical protein
MKIRVTIRAVLANVGKNRLGMARNAFHVFVHAAQGITRLAVIEFRYGADGPPAGRGVAVLARDPEWAVWVAGGLFLRFWRRMPRKRRAVFSGGEEQERPERELE